MNSRAGFKVAKVLGFEVRLDASWFILFFLVLWSLSAGVFPATLPGLGTGTYIAMGFAGSVLLFASILLHELAHSLVARRRGIAIHGITLFVFGGLAHTAEEPRSADDELVIAGVGPLVSLVLGGVFLGLGAAGFGPAVSEVARYLGYINLVLAAFNLLPGYPLDGGRVLRALAWKRTGDFARASRLATAGGRWIGMGLIVLGVLEALAGALLGGIWLVFIGMFLRSAAATAAGQHALEHALRGVRAADVMLRNAPVVDAHTTLRDVAAGPALQSTRPAFPVRENGRIVGRLELERIRATSREAWSSTVVGEVMEPLDERTVVGPETDMTEVLERIRTSPGGQVFVMQEGCVLGSIVRSDLAELAVRARAFAGR
ncbi:MAG TPA: site-2 protease family protein [Longimicrobiales bacterium]|nr:site-2 protease family protein [Longimicrobiales bacterium]